MERINVLINKLNEQHRNEATAADMLITLQLLQQELLGRTAQNGMVRNVSVIVPGRVPVVKSAPEVTVLPKEPAAPVVTVTPPAVAITPPPPPPQEHAAYIPPPQTAAPVPPASPYIVAEPEQPVAEASPQEEEKIIFSLEPMEEEVPAVAVKQPEPLYIPPVVQTATPAPVATASTNTQSSLNDMLKTSGAELAETLSDPPIKDLRKAMSINDRYIFINQLFMGDETMFERSIKTINNFNIFPEAQYWIRRELALKMGWRDDDETVKQFYKLVQRRFS